MTLTISGRPNDIARSLDLFSENYHADFLMVRRQASVYLGAARPEIPAAKDLALALHAALRSWGAGRRSAPKLQRVSNMTATLASSELHKGMVELRNAFRTGPTIVSGCRGFAGVGATTITVPAFDAHLFDAITQVSNGLFVNNTNLTYPMKTILLITGLMPAFDSQVRRGLSRGGFAGMTSNQNRMPDTPSGATWEKMSRLPFVLGQCWHAHKGQLRAQIRRSNHRVLLAEPGRVFDVLLFMQRDPSNRVILRWRGRQKWYHIQ